MTTSADIRGLHRLMDDYVDGDRRAFARLYAMLQPRLRGFLMKLVPDSAVVDDIVQLTFLNAHLARERFARQGDDADGAVKAWYFAIARNAALDHLRQLGRRAPQNPSSHNRSGDPMGELASLEPDVEQSLVEDEQERDVIKRVREAIARLPPAQQEVLELHKLRGMSMADIAQRLAIREGAVRVRAHRAYKMLARLLVPGTLVSWLT